MEIIEITRDNVYNSEQDFSDVFTFTVLGTEEQRDDWYYKDDIFVAVCVHLGGDVRGNYGPTRLYRTDNLAEGFLDWTVGWDVESWDMSDTTYAEYDTEALDDKFISKWCGYNTLLERDDKISERCSIGYAFSPTSELYSHVGGERCFWHDGSAYIVHDSVLYRCTPYHYQATVDTPENGHGYTCDAMINTESFLTEVLGEELDIPDEVAEKWDNSDEVIAHVQSLVFGELEPEDFCSYHTGQPYNDVRSLLQSVDFGDCYPVVYSDGKNWCLTGECIPGDTDGYSICDIDSDGNVQRHEHATEAMVED